MPRWLAAFCVFALPIPLLAADWPQWLGPDRSAVWSETGILKTFPADGPKMLWRVPIGGGYAGPAVAGGKVFLADKVLKPGAVDPKDPFSGNKVKVPSIERVACLDAKTGKELWKHEHETTYAIQYPSGPRCTPTVHAGKVYALGAMGDLFCLDAATGQTVWSKNYPKDFGAKVPIWGFSGHPLVYKNLLICLTGSEKGVLAALDKDTGAVKWQALETAEPGYNSPMLIEAGGTVQLLIWTPRAVYGLNPDTGTRYWQAPLEPKYGMSIMTVRKDGDYLFAAGIGNVGVTLRLDPVKPAVTEVWRGTGEPNPKTGIYPVNMTPFIEKGVIYGADQPGMFRAVELTTGKRLWSTFKPIFGEEKDEDFKGGASGTVFVVKNGERFFLFSETGDLAIARLSPKGYEEVSRAHLLAPTTPALNGRKVVWSHPAFAEKCVFARNDREIVCASLAE